MQPVLVYYGYVFLVQQMAIETAICTFLLKYLAHSTFFTKFATENVKYGLVRLCDTKDSHTYDERLARIYPV